MSTALFWVNARAGRMRLPRLHALDLTLMLMIGATLGGRLFHVLWEEPQYYLDQPLAIFKVWQGGFVFYGGLFGAFAMMAWWARRKNLPFLQWADFFAPVAAFAYAFGRLGCFFNGCCFGRYCTLPWAVEGRHPTQLYATFLELMILAFLLWLEKKPKLAVGQIFYSWILLHGINRIIMELFRDDDRGPMPMGVSVSTWLSLLLIIFAISRVKKANVSP